MKFRNRQEMTKQERLATDRVDAKKMIDGTLLVPTKTCRKCGGYALVKDGALEIRERMCVTGTAIVPEITICIDGCKHVAVRNFGNLGRHSWTYGTQVVEIVEGPSYVMKQLPQRITPKHRTRLQEFLVATQ